MLGADVHSLATDGLVRHFVVGLQRVLSPEVVNFMSDKQLRLRTAVPAGIGKTIKGVQ